MKTLHHKGRIAELDGIRATAIILVVIWHYVISTSVVTPGSHLDNYLAFGRLTWSGVDLFFVLSGFLIGGILLDARDSTNFFKVFYVRRALRILPVYAALLVILWLVNLLINLPPELASFSLKDGIPSIYYVTLTQNFWIASHNNFGAGALAVTWSLAVEEQFYLTLPIVVKLIKRESLRWIVCAVILMSICLRLIIFYLRPQSPFATYVALMCRADSLMMGVGGALIVRSERGFRFLTQFRWVLQAALFILGAGVLLGTLKYWTVGRIQMVSIGYTWLALFYLCVLLLAISKKDSLISMVLRLPPLVWIGGLAYGIYLFHKPILDICFSVFLSEKPRLSSPIEVLVTALATLLTLGVSAMSWKFFEQPLVLRGRRFRYSWLAESRKYFLSAPVTRDAPAQTVFTNN